MQLNQPRYLEFLQPGRDQAGLTRFFNTSWFVWTVVLAIVFVQMLGSWVGIH